MISKDDIRRYDPVGVRYEGDPYNGYAVMVSDRFGVLPDFWVDCWISGGDIMTDWNQYIFNTRMYNDHLRSGLQNSPRVTDRATDAALAYLAESGLVAQDRSGNWMYIVPGNSCASCVSMGRKAYGAMGYDRQCAYCQGRC